MEKPERQESKKRRKPSPRKHWDLSRSPRRTLLKVREVPFLFPF